MNCAVAADHNETTPDGALIVVSAPSGAGKTTLCHAVLSRLPGLRYSVSSTTRQRRPGEQDGVDYHFISESEFKKGIDAGQWVEWARVHGHFYGTSARFIDAQISSGHCVLLDIDVQGARQILGRFPRAITIFIAPPSMAVLRQRLEQRGTDDADTIARRLANAETEMACRHDYRHIVVNDDLELAITELCGLIRAHCPAGRSTP